jgi:tetratricopeptide (TPR) repeat protein
MKRQGRRRKPRSTRSPDRDTNSAIPWIHGLAAMGDERWSEAIEALQRFLGMVDEPKDRWVAYQNLSVCYLALEQYDKALAALDEVERCTPDDPDTPHSRGIIYACAGRIPEAIAAFELFARRWPRQARQLETRKTIRQLRRAQRGKVSAGAYLVDHLQNQVSQNVEMGDFHLVERKARRMIAAEPNRPEGHFALGVACVEQGHYPEALEAFLAAHARDPGYAPTLYNIGHTYLQMDEPEQAIAWLERALRRESKHLPALHQLGVACERLGRRDEAVERWRRALKADPGCYPAQQSLHEIGQGPEPTEPPLPPKFRQMKALTPVVKARMKRLQVYRSGDLTLTYDGKVGFVLEDEGNSRNATVYAGGPFQTGHVKNEDDLLDMIGMFKMLLHMANVENTREVAVLAYYTDRPVFNYNARFERGKRVKFDAHGQFVVTETPRFFKLSIDSDLSTPYGDPMQGLLIYLKQSRKSGILVSTLGLAGR